MKRKFYNVLMEWKNKNINTPLMVVGVKQIGKTYIINEFCKNEFEDYIYINLMEKQNIVKIFEEESDFETKVRKIELDSSIYRRNPRIRKSYKCFEIFL